MPDQVLTRDGPVAVPLNYTVPQSGELLPLVVRATLDGSAATSSFYAVCQIIAPSGRIMGNCVSASIAAGGSADVTWFPGVDVDEDTSLANYNAAVTALGPWAYWKLNEPAGSTTAADSSGFGRTLTTIDSSGTNTFGQPGLLPASAQTSDLISFAAASNVYPLETGSSQTFSSTSLTVEAWIKTTGGTGHDMIVSELGRLDTERIWQVLVLDAGGVEIAYIDSGAVGRGYIFAAPVKDGTAHQLVFTIDGTNVKCYVDGALFGTQAQVGALNVPATKVAYIGGAPGGAASRVYSGNIGPVIVYASALTASQIANLYNQGTGGAAGAGGTSTVTAGDTSIVVGGTATNVTLETASLDVIAADHPTAANWSNNSKKITALAAGAAANEGAVWDQTDAGIVTTKGDLVVATGSHAVSRLGVGADTNVLTADSTQSTGVKWAAAGSSSPLTTKGDIFGHSTVDARIPVGSDNQALIADSSQTLGVKWATIGTGGIGGLVQLFDSTLGADTASIDTGASGIAAGHGALAIFMLLRTDEAAVFSTGNITFNNDTSAIYDYINLFQSSTTLTGQRTSAQTSVQVLVHGANGSASYATAVFMYVPGYDQTTFWKAGGVLEAGPDETAASQDQIWRSFGYRATAALSRMKVAAAGAAKLKTGSRLTIYGTQ